VRLHISPFSFFSSTTRPDRPPRLCVSLISPAPIPSAAIAGISHHWTSIMKRKMPNAAHVWKQLDDFVVPNLRLNVIDRAVYSHLLRHTRLECRHRLCFSQLWLAKGIGVCRNTARSSLRRLVDRGAVRLIENSYGGHLVEVLLPEEIRAALPDSPHRALLCRSPKASSKLHAAALSINELDFFATRSLRAAIYARERHLCFYCLRRLKKTTRCLDHVIAQMHSGGNSYRNLVACCMECNSRKAQKSAADFLCSLFRERRLTTRLLASRLRALEALTAGKLRPRLPKNALRVG
jgi:HNH endonuclease